MKNQFTKQFLRFVIIILVQIFGFLQVKAQTETIPSGSFIVNMGNTNIATINDDVRPYGMMYDLMRNHNVPIKWVINPGKIKDGADFTHNGIVYKGGTFIVPAGFRTTTVNARISFWQTQGVVGATSISDFSATVFKTLTSIPRWTLDAGNGGIAQGYLTAAGITLATFPNAYNWKAPQTLDCCDDFFVMPHADPTWATHSRLYTWNKQCLGSIWAACHAVSALENSINPTNSTEQMNFLSTRTSATIPAPWPNNSLKLWGKHSGGSPAYTHTLFNDPVAQYMGVTDLSQLNGSEQIYIPKQAAEPNGATRWRPGANIIAYDATQADVPNPDYANGNVAAVMVYGRGMDDPTRGYVMYEAGHSHLKGTASDGAALRAFLNFSFFQVQPKAPQLTVTGVTAGQIIPGTTTITGLNVNATSPLSGITFTYLWISSCGGTFSAPTGSTTNFTAPTVASNTDCIITCKVTDNCGRTSISSFPVVIKAANPPTVINDAATLDPGCGGTPSVTKNVLTNDIDPNGDPINLTQINGNSGSPFTIPGQGTVSFTAGGNVTFTAVEGFTGVVNLTYQVCDNSTPTPLCSNGTYAITVGDANKVPTVAADAATIAEDAFAPTSINVLANDIQVGGYTGGALSVRSVISGPANGRVSVNPDNTITYIPNADFAGTDNLTYEVVNASGYRRSAVVTITVTNNSCDAGTYEASPSTSGTATYQMSNAPVPPTTFGDAMIRQIVLALNNWGADTELEVNADNGVQPQRGLIQFNLSGIPGGATITNSQLRLVRTGGNNTAQNIGAYRVTTTWNEGTGNNNANTAIINGSTWFTTSFTTNWQNGGGDFNTTNGAVTSVSNNTGGIGGTTTYGWNVTTLTQGWYAGTFTNNGLILKDVLEDNGNDKVFGSLNNGTPGNRPVLRVTYEVTPGVPVVLDIQATKDTWIQHEENYEDVFGTGTGNEFQVNQNGGNNQADRLLLKFDLTAPTSGSVPPITSTISSSTLTLNRTGGDNTAVSIGVYQATNSWNEANDPSTRNTPVLNGATWHTRNFTQTWTTPGGDFNLTPTSSQSVLATAAYNWDVLGIVQNWFNPVPAANHGFLVKAVTEVGNFQQEFASRENTTAALRPTLVINYSNPGVCGAIPNRAPLANPDYGYTTNSISPLVISDVKTNDSDESALTVTGATLISGSGTVGTITANGFTFTPTSGAIGVAVVEYTVSDGVLTDVARVTIIVTNGPISATNDVSSANSGVVQNINVMTNDTDPENQKGVLSIVTPPANGAAVVNDNGTPANFADDFIAYTPNAGYTGTDAFTYQICEALPVISCPATPFCATATVNITVVNRTPVAVNDSRSILPCIATTLNLVSNDTDPENGILMVTNLSALSIPAAGILTNNNDGTVTFLPAVGFLGIVTFTYTVTDNGVTPMVSAPATVTINVFSPVNNAPDAINDTETLNMDETNYANVRDNDTDPDGDDLRLPTITVAPLHGTAIVLENGLIQYTPNPGYYGTDVLTYQLCDSSKIPATCAVAPPLCDVATLSYTIVAPNTVVAINDENSTWINTPVSGGVLGNDFDPQGDNPLIFNGFNIGGTLYTSGTHTVGGFDQNGSPVANAGTITINPDGTYIFTPALNFIGVVNVPYSIQDSNTNAATDSANLRITVNPLPGVANSVIANNDENRVFGGATLSSTLFANDRDPQTNPFTVTGYMYDTNGDGTPDGTGTVGSPVTVGGVTTSGLPVSNAGLLTINANGTYTFTPAADFTGSIDVPYTICDNVVPPACATAILHIDVLVDPNGLLNNPPQPGDDFAYTKINTPVTSTFITNDSDPNNDPVSLNGITINTAGPATPIGAPVPTAKGGTVQYFANGTYTYTPPAGYVGPDSVAYEICDVTAIAPQPLCNRAFLHLLVGVNNTTDAINDETSTWQDVNVSGGVLSNDFDAESHTQTFGSFLAQGATPGAPIASGATVSGVNKSGAPVANAGTLTFLADGSYTFDPNPSFTGTVSVPYKVCDNGNLSKCDTAYLTITVDPLPTTGINTLISNNDENISYGAMVGGSLFINDRDPQNDAFTVTSFIGGAVGTPGMVAGVDLNGNPVANAGTLTINADGTYTFTPAPGFVGAVNVPYTITDANGATATAILQIDVLKDPNGILNDPSVAGDDFGYTTINKPVTGSFISNDSDPNADPVSYMGVTINPAGPATPIGAPVATAAGGTVQFYANGTYLYTPPLNYVGPDRLPYTICDVTVVTPQPLCADATIHLLVGPGVNISGRVWDDANGNVNINGIETGTNATNTLYVNLVDGSGNIVATTTVAADGTYSFANINPGTNYALQLSTNQGTVGNPAPPVALPAGWVNTGESRNGTIDGGVLGVVDTRNYGYTNTINFDFGIERLPETQTLTTVITTPILGQIITLNGGANPPVLEGSDPEDQPVSGGLTNKSVQISTIPTNSNLFYNGVLVTAGQIIPNFDPALLTIQFTAASIGSTSTSFTYAYVDSAGKVDPTPATYTLSWLGALPIDIVSFIANKVNNTSLLNFEIAQPVQGSVFTIERSTTGGGFTAIGTLNSTNATRYTFVDAVPVQNAKNFYRIKETDARGQVSYSVIRMVKFTNDIKIEVYPVPASANINITLNDAMLNQPITLTLYNSQGQEVIRKFVNRANATETIDVQSFTNGVYQLRILNNATVVAERKVVIIH